METDELIRRLDRIINSIVLYDFESSFFSLSRKMNLTLSPTIDVRYNPCENVFLKKILFDFFPNVYSDCDKRR
jgi:hypothetical protein